MVIVTVLAAAFVGVGSAVTLPEYAISPGGAPPVKGLIALPAGKGARTTDRILFTYVDESQVRLIDWIPDEIDANVDLVPAQDLLGPAPASQLIAEGSLQMAQAEQAAQVAAFRALGWTVPGTPVGGLVDLIGAGTPAIKSLQVGDVITAVDGVPTAGPSQVVEAIHSKRPGATVTLSVVPFSSMAAPSSGAGQAGRVRAVRVTLAGRMERGRRVAFLGIDLDPAPAERFPLPFSVPINAGSIGGPSAGLAITLGIVDALTTGNLTGGVTVAATGTIDPNGRVGDVGGVAQKAVAVSAAGAKLFLVPVPEVSVARRHVARGVSVMGVSTLAQALRDLRALRCPPPGGAGSGSSSHSSRLRPATGRHGQGLPAPSARACDLLPPLHSERAGPGPGAVAASTAIAAPHVLHPQRMLSSTGAPARLPS